ncbi:Protein spt10 [Elasticomyces elasticus]|nr:Protein spt10 [Elasticomyces elasticus]
MPAMLDDPTAPVIYRTSGPAPYPTPFAPLPPEIAPRQVTLRDRVTVATLIPFLSPDQVPKSLLKYLCALLNREILKGDTYPMIAELPFESFGPYWFANFGAVMLLGDIKDQAEVMQMDLEGKEWEKQCLGSFYIKPNYPGRSSHVCNGGFLVTDAARNRGVGRLMGEGYIEWAPKLGYSYSVFNLVYETNVASLRIWDALGFKRIGRVKGCGNLKSYPEQLIDAIIFGRELGTESDDYVSEERFDKIRYYLKNGTYPNGADRAEKSRLRSAATHYKLVPGDAEEDDKLMLKDKEVISDPHKQYEIARTVHNVAHGGINKTTASIAEKYHWVRIKETVSLAIRNCSECKEVANKPVVRPESNAPKRSAERTPSVGAPGRSAKVSRTESPQSRSPLSEEHISPPPSLDHQSPPPQSLTPRLGAVDPNIAPALQQQQPVPIADMHSFQRQNHWPVDPHIDPRLNSRLMEDAQDQPFSNVYEHAEVQHDYGQAARQHMDVWAPRGHAMHDGYAQHGQHMHMGAALGVTGEHHDMDDVAQYHPDMNKDRELGEQLRRAAYG